MQKAEGLKLSKLKTETGRLKGFPSGLTRWAGSGMFRTRKLIFRAVYESIRVSICLQEGYPGAELLCAAGRGAFEQAEGIEVGLFRRPLSPAEIRASGDERRVLGHGLQIGRAHV